MMKSSAEKKEQGGKTGILIDVALIHVRFALGLNTASS
jgi:hypothetical protein